MPLETPARIVSELASRGYNAEREAVTLIARAPDPDRATELTLASVPAGALKITTDHVRTALDDLDPGGSGSLDDADETGDAETPDAADGSAAGDPLVSTGTPGAAGRSAESDVPPETGGSGGDGASVGDGASAGPIETTGSAETTAPVEAGGVAEPTTGSPASAVESNRAAPGTSARAANADRRSVAITNDVTGQSTGTGEYSEFVTVFRDRLERLSGSLRGRVNARPASSIQAMPGGGDVAMIGMVNDVRSTANGHWLIELEDTTGVFPFLILKDREFAGVVDEILRDEVLAMEGTLADDAGIAFVDSLHFPDVPRTHRPNTADRHVQAALISDVHVGSQEFMADAWNRFADWLHTEEAERVEYLLIAGDMVEGVGVYPNQDEELSIVDLYEQYEAFSEHLKSVPGDMEIVMIPGNHDAVRLAEPQPAFDEELREIMGAHDARITGNPSTVTIEGVNVLMYHGVSLDEIIAELPEDKASYDEPHKAMYHLLKKRHVAPQYGERTRLAPEEKDYLVMDEVPDVFHTGHVHKLGYGKYHNVMAINSGCWQAQTDFQKSVNIDPDSGYAPILDLDTLEMTVRKFA